MSRIAALDPTSASGHVRELLDGVQKGLGATPNLFRIAARSPATPEGRVAAADPRLAAAVRFARLAAEKRGAVTDEDVTEGRRAGLGDDEILEIVTNLALTTFTNYLNQVATTEIDFPVVHHLPR